LRPLIASGSEKRRNGITSLTCREKNYERKDFITDNGRNNRYSKTKYPFQ
jgi:hypothetical protein